MKDVFTVPTMAKTKSLLFVEQTFEAPPESNEACWKDKESHLDWHFGIHNREDKEKRRSQNELGHSQSALLSH